MKSGEILIVPASERGLGGGHLGRSFFLLKTLREKGRGAFLFIPENKKDEVIQRFHFLMEDTGPIPHNILSRREELKNHTWDFIILDRFKTPAEEFGFWAALPGRVPLIGIDEGGPCRNRFDFLIDLLPSLSTHKPNLSAPWLLPLPKNRRPPDAGQADPPRILISFGAEDLKGLGLYTARKLLSHPSFAHSQVTLISGSNEPELPGIKVIDHVVNLKEQLAQYDLFITHFGLGAFEAVYARVPVLLLSPTPYHKKLAKNAGFSVKTGAWRQIARRFGLEEDQREDLASYINDLEPRSSGNCPVCEAKAGPVLARFPEETYRRCPACGIIYLSRLKAPPVEYGKEYFFDSYKKQYGKTYLEDFPNLKEMGRKRLKHIRNLTTNIEPSVQHEHRTFGSTRTEEKNEPSLLDIGCAYGPFLAAAAECGFSPYGIEPAEDAVRYVKEVLGFNVWHGFFPDALPENAPGQYDVISLWYVIEHFQEPGNILRKIHKLLKDGGVLAFSTPSSSGISGRKSLRNFLKNSPEDHYTVWNPASCKKILRQHGFLLRKVVITGHHPERFPLLGRLIDPSKKCLLYRLLLLISRVFRLGDTFEAYAVPVHTQDCQDEIPKSLT